MWNLDRDPGGSKALSSRQTLGRPRLLSIKRLLTRSILVDLALDGGSGHVIDTPAGVDHLSALRGVAVVERDARCDHYDRT